MAADLPGQLELDLPAQHFDEQQAQHLAAMLATSMTATLGRFDLGAVVICARLQRVPG